MIEGIIAARTGRVAQTESITVGAVEMIYAYPYALFEGVVSKSLEVVLPRNALVDEYLFEVRAQRVDMTLVQDVAQVRSYSSSDGNELIIDFGTPRTVSGIDLPDGSDVLTVYPWLGSQFSPVHAYNKFAADAGPSAVFPELRTERLRVRVSRALTSAQLLNLTVRLPEPPSGLEIRIDDGPPVWTHPEPVQPRSGVAEADEDGWSGESRRLVRLTDALAALTGDPLASDDLVTFTLKLTTKVPCVLDLKPAGAPKIRRIRRVRFGQIETATTLRFDSEGFLELPLVLPQLASGVRRIDELRWVAAADLPPWRVDPPLGPAPAAGVDQLVLADLLVDPERAACVRLPGRGPLAELTGIRLPLRAIGDGAEARVVLWSAGATGSAPSAPLPQGTSAPVTLLPATLEQWVTFAFARPVAVDREHMPWLALIVARGQLEWSLARASINPADSLDGQVLRGPPNGPWKALPAPLQNAAGLLDARARLRLSGVPPKGTPLAPLTLALGAQPAVDLTPTPKGAAGLLVQSPGLELTPPILRLVSRTAGDVELRDIDVTSNN